MIEWSLTRTIVAPVGRVFAVIAQPSEAARTARGVVSVEYVSDRRAGVGTRFREVRHFEGNPRTTELVITECVANRRIRFSAEEHGIRWDSLYSFSSSGTSTRLDMVMTATTGNLAKRLLLRAIAGRVESALDEDLDAVKAFSERRGARRPGPPREKR